MRRSTRVPAEIELRVRSLDPGVQFEEKCKTLLVNAQGCGFQCSRQLPVGIALLFMIQNRQVTATVLNATSLGEGSGAWVIGAKLHQCGNFWGLLSPPADWEQPVPPPRQRPEDTDQYIAGRVAVEIRRQTVQAMVALRSEIDKLAAARKTEFLATIVEESSSTAVEIVHRVVEQETDSIRTVFETLSAQLRRGVEEHSAKQMDLAEERLRELQAQLSTLGEERIQAAASEILQRIHRDAKQLSDTAIAQWHAAFEQTLQMLPDLVRENLQRSGTEVTVTRH